MADNIILIGFMGVGKGRTARVLAAKTGLYTVDTDDLIETMVNMKIRQIFKHHGEPYFRLLEQRTGDWLRRHVNRTIISTGGGFVKVKNLGKGDTIIYLHSSLKKIIRGIENAPNAAKKIKKRPLLRDMEHARLLYDERLPLYRNAADLEINVEGRTAEETAERIIKKLKLRRLPAKNDFSEKCLGNG
jgi:shikimate kinase